MKRAGFLYDLVLRITVPCAPHVKRLGYLREALDIRGRYQRCGESWNPHLGRSKRFIVETMRQCPMTRKAIVLGSGLLLDVPVEELSAHFKEVVLVDILHLPEVADRLKGLPNVRTVQCDVTGIAENISRLRNQMSVDPGTLPEPKALIPEFDDQTDLVISLNMLSQIYLWPKQFIGARIGGGEERALTAWTRRIVETHFEMLSSLPCTVCLITDYEYYARSRQGTLLVRESTIEGVKLPEPDRQWVWDIAPLGEMSRDYAVYRNVAGIRLGQRDQALYLSDRDCMCTGPSAGEAQHSD